MVSLILMLFLLIRSSENRLRAHYERVCAEMENERDMEGRIKEAIDAAEYG